MSDDNRSLCRKHGWYADTIDCPACEDGMPKRDLDKLEAVGSGSAISHAGKDVRGILKGPDGRWRPGRAEKYWQPW